MSAVDNGGNRRRCSRNHGAVTINSIRVLYMVVMTLLIAVLLMLIVFIPSPDQFESLPQSHRTSRQSEGTARRGNECQPGDAAR